MFLLVLALAATVPFIVPWANSQGQDALITSSYQAFTQLANIYRSGGSAPDLVAKLNSAIELIQNARLKRAEGNTVEALKLESQARSTFSEIMAQIPGREQQAESEATLRMVTVLLFIPLVVLVSTFLFFLGLKAWRWYERAKLYEMRIVDKKKAEG